ncbi:hypothetical protein NSMM_690006 [Nitrosomonas mobilis]|uniref:Uncharacterized protein n=1 Tax=Nitrosomonas mobilis TaxID=51642 RepID=A0A1G5SHM6_9PROT|nr:hypothetical protein NSMM_690006 [Nitrosomonas mobilis]
MSGTKRKNFTGNLKAKAVLEAIRGIKTVNESVINALEAHGLDKFSDHGIDSFKRYVAPAIVARNIHRIGDILWQQDVEREQKTNAQHSKYRQMA